MRCLLGDKDQRGVVLLRELGEAGEEREDALHRESVGLTRFFRSAAGGILADLFVQLREEHVYAARGVRRRSGTCDWTVTVTPLDAAELIHARALESPHVGDRVEQEQVLATLSF